MLIWHLTCLFFTAGLSDEYDEERGNEYQIYGRYRYLSEDGVEVRGDSRQNDAACQNSISENQHENTLNTNNINQWPEDEKKSQIYSPG